MFSLKKLKKKVVAYATIAAVGVSTVFMPIPKAEALSLGSVIVGVGTAVLSGSAQMKQVKKQIDVMDNTEEGRQELYQSFREKTGVNTDYSFNARLDTIMANLTKAVGVVDPSIYDKPYLYYVAQQEQLNAACSMGHVMLVNAGTFKLLSNDDEIAAVVGHEMGHGQMNHVAKGIKKSLNKQMIAGIAASAAGGGSLANVAASLALNNSVAHGTRKQETEADNMAWEYIQHTNYNLGACAAAMQKIAELYGEKNKSNLLNPSDHPDTDKRRDNYVSKLEEYSGKHATAKNGVVSVNGETFMIVAEAEGMSSVERSFFVLGNLASAFHNGQHKNSAKVNGNTVLLGNQPIVSVAEGDESAQTLAERLNELIALSNK